MFKDLKVVFMGTPSFSVPVLKMLIENTNVIAVVSQPDKMVGRKKEITYSPVKKVAIENNIEVLQPIKIRQDYEKIISLNPDIIITAAYGQIVPKEVLDLPRLGCINIHGSLLPKYRGAAPIQWSIINGDKYAGITLMYMDETMDTGNMIASDKIIIEKEDNVKTLYEKLSILGANLLKNNLEALVSGTNASVPQDENKVSYARMLKREDELILFNDSTLNIFNKIKGIYPNAYCMINNETFKILEADYKLANVNEASIMKVDKKEMAISTNDGYIIPLIVKPFGKKEMDIKSYLNGINKEIYNGKKVNDSLDI